MLSAIEALRQRTFSSQVPNSQAVARSKLPHSASALQETSGSNDAGDYAAHPDRQSLAALVVDPQTPLSSVRSINELNASTVAVDLECGQRFIVLGLCSFWILDGTVSVLGARLPASRTLHQLCSPRTHAIPEIEGVAGFSTVVLHSAEGFIQHLPRFENGNVSNASVSDARSFSVPGHPFTRDPAGVDVRELKILDTNQWRSAIISASDPCRIEHDLNDQDDLPYYLADRTERRIFIAGARLTGKSTFTRCIINRMITDRDPSTKQLCHPDGVFLIDMDAMEPECSAPGMVYLAHIRVPILGPALTHPMFSDSARCRILRMHHQFAANQSKAWYRSALQDILLHQHVLAAQHQCPTVINTSTWLGGDSCAEGLLPWAAIAPTDVVCFDSWTSIKFRGVLSDYAKMSRSRFHPLRVTPFKSPVTPESLRSLQFEAYFHIASSETNTSRWSNVSPLISGTELILKYDGPDRLLWAMIESQLTHRRKRMLNELEHATVAILAIEGNLAVELVTRGQGCGSQLAKWGPGGPLYLLLPDQRNFEGIDPARSECLGVGFLMEGCVDRVAGLLKVSTLTKMEAVMAKVVEGKKIVLIISEYM